MIKPFICLLIYSIHLICVKQKELIRLKCEAKLKDGFYVDSEAIFLVIIIVINPKSRIILQLQEDMFFLTQWIGFIFDGCWLVTSLADWEICQGLFVLNF